MTSAADIDMVQRPGERALGRPRSGDAGETRVRLLAVARESFARNSYASTTNRDIADAVGITTGAIYHYYSSKADLYFAVYEGTQGLIYQSFYEAMDGKVLFAERFSGVLDAAMALNHSDPAITAFVLGVLNEAQRHPELARLLRPLRGENRRFLRRLVGDAYATGEIAADVEPETVENLLNVILTGLARFNKESLESDEGEVSQALKRLVGGSLFSAPAISAPAISAPAISAPPTRSRTRKTRLSA